MKPLPKPVFFDTDALKHEQELIEIFEGLADRKLYPAQLETLLIKLITYVGSVLRADAHHSLLQNLVQFAEGEMIDQHAINRSINHEIKRIDASFAKTTLRFSTDTVVARDILIPIFTHVSSADGQFTFVTDGEVKLIAGQLSIDIAATANIKGKAANDLSVGTLTELEEPIAYIDAVQNITITSGGADIEDDDHFKERVRTADNLLSKGGPIGGYIGLVFGVHADIKAVTIKSPLPNDIHVYPLLSTGIASQEIKQIILDALSAETERPLGDLVVINNPAAITYSLNIEVYLKPNVIASKTLADLDISANALTQKWQQQLGQDIIPSLLVTELQTIDGVNHINLDSITPYQAVSDIEFPLCTNIVIVNMGVFNG